MDPYKVLGIPTTASDDEVKQAYRKLAKEYHPDANPGDPVAEQKMKEINAAYDQIINKKNTGQSAYGQQGTGGYYDPFSGFRGHQTYANAQESPKMRAARNYINYRRYQEALHVLSEVEERNAAWYYYNAVAHCGLGNRIQALQYAQQAVSLDPDNPEDVYKRQAL